MTNADRSRAVDFPARRVDVEWVELDGEVVLYDPTTQVLHHLNPGAAVVWASCDGSTSVAQIMREIDDAYIGRRHEIARDVRTVISRFRRLGLLRAADEAGEAG
jgi:hypothetical protein